VYQLRLRNGERNAQARRPGFKSIEDHLESPNVAAIGEGCNSEGKVIHIRDHKTPGDAEVKGGNVEEKK